jgi:hypothetical protein
LARFSTLVLSRFTGQPQMLDASLIIEGIVTTQDADGSVNISPMGPRVETDFSRLVFRPFSSSRTWHNLRRHGQGVFHVTDDVELIARSAVGQLDVPPRCRRAEAVDGWILEDTCRWFAFQVRTFSETEPRATIDCQVVDSGRVRDFLGFNRARHAVIEAAILATRVGLLAADELLRPLDELSTWVEKTGGERERRTFDFLRNYIHSQLAAGPADGGSSADEHARRR